MPALQQPKTSADNAKPRPTTLTLSSTLQPPSSMPSKLQLQPNGAMETWLAGDDIKPVQLTIPPGVDLPRREWVTLYRLRTGVGRFGANMYSWSLRPSAACLSGAPEARTSFGLPHWPDQPAPAAPWSSIAAGLIRKKICKSLGIAILNVRVMPRISNKIK